MKWYTTVRWEKVAKAEYQIIIIVIILFEPVHIKLTAINPTVPKKKKVPTLTGILNSSSIITQV